MVDENEVRELVRVALIKYLSETGENKLNSLRVKVNASNRHVHLTREHMDILFGKDSNLTKVKDLIQPGEFASDQFVSISDSKGSLNKVRVLGPLRKYTQVEVSLTDTFTLGVKNVPLRDSGNLEGTPGITITGPAGSIELDKGLILAQRHVHMLPSDAEPLGLKNGDFVKMRIEGDRALVFDRVLIRVSPKYALEAHVDIDEANAAMITPDTYGILEL